MRRFRVENHPDVISGTLSTSAALNHIVTAFGHEDVTLKLFLNFHKYQNCFKVDFEDFFGRDVSMCVDEDKRFFELTNALWTQVHNVHEDET